MFLYVYISKILRALLREFGAELGVIGVLYTKNKESVL